MIVNLTDSQFQRVARRKELDGYKEKAWDQWLQFVCRDTPLDMTLTEPIQRGTFEGLASIWMENFAENLPLIRAGRGLSKLKVEGPTGEPAIVVGRGPSLFKQKHLELLAQSDFKGKIIVTDGALIDALKAGVKPYAVVSVDGHRELIKKWYDHPLVYEKGKGIVACLIGSIAHNVVEVAEKAGMEIYFWLPMFDDWRQISSFTRLQLMMCVSPQNKDGIPALQTGGNAGSAAWNMAWIIFGCSPIVLIGMDMGYLPGSPLEETYYYKGMMETFKDTAKVVQCFREVENPDIGCKAIIDPVFSSYRMSMLDMINSQCPSWTETVNCTEGGSLYGGKLVCKPLKVFLEECRKTK